MSEGVLLDTCACLWLTHGDPMQNGSLAAIRAAQASAGIWISAITAGEVATLVRKGRYRLKVTPEVWFERLLDLPGVGLAPLAPAILIAAAFLPGDPPADPADRMICATARALGLSIVTRDRRILAYADAGHLNAVGC